MAEQVSRAETKKSAAVRVRTTDSEISSSAGDRAPPRPSLRMIADAPAGLADDRLGFASYADALAGLIHNEATHTPLTLAINAPWGAGKSSLARMIEQELERKRDVPGTLPHVVCTFNAWMHDDAEHLATAFTAEVAQCASRHRPWWQRVLRPTPREFESPGMRRVWDLARGTVIVLVALALAGLVFQGILQPPDPAQVEASARSPDAAPPSWISQLLTLAGPDGAIRVLTPQLDAVWGAVFVFLTLVVFFLHRLRQVASAVGSFIRSPADQAGAGSMRKVRSQLGSIIAQATRHGKRRFVVFIDDLERCQPPRGIDVLEAANQLLDHKDVVVVVMADMPAVARAAEIKYADLARREAEEGAALGSAAQHYGRRYLQKIVQLQFDLPPQSPERMHRLMAEIAREAEEKQLAPPARVSALREAILPILLPVSYVRRGRDGFYADVAAAIRATPSAAERALAWTAYALSLPARVFLAPIVRPDPPSAAPLRAARNASTRLLAYYGATLALLWIALSTAADATDRDGVWDLLFAFEAFALAGVPFGLLTFVVYNVAVAWRTGAKARAYRAAFERSLDTEGAGVARPEGVDASVLDAIESERLQSHFTRDATLLAEATDEVMKHHPPHPRNAKRLLNRLRLLLFIAGSRRILGTEGGLGPREIGKWAVLQERWPELAQALLHRPFAMGDLEDAAAGALDALEDAEAFRRTVRSLAPAYELDASLLRFCTEAPYLKEALPRLIAFERVDEGLGPNVGGPTAA